VPATIRPVLVTPHLDRLLSFYTELLGATEVMRFPEDGPVFYVGLALGDSELGISTDASVVPGEPGRMLLSIEVPDVARSSPGSRRSAARAATAPTTCRGVSGSPT